VARLIVVALAVLVLIALLRAFVRASPEAITRSIKVGAISSAAVGLIFLLASGRLSWLVAAIGGLVAVLVRLMPVIAQLAPALHRLWRWKRTTAGASGTGHGNSSVVESRFVRMRLDHDSGELSGVVLEGGFAGRQINDLTMDQVVQLLQTCQQHDEDSAALVRAYLDRIYGERWRAAASGEETGPQAPGSHSMTVGEAYQILGLTAGVSKREVIEAHRRLIQKLHPDRGGTDYLAATINRAKELLLRQ
jgi:hypothetical protein